MLADARVQLGDLRGAREAVERMLDLRPGVASFARASYAAELRGDLDGARRYLQYAHEDARVPADLAYARHQLGELALHAHDFETADRWYARALETDPGYTPALAGRARAAALGGRLDEALTRYEGVVRRLPLPQYLIEQGEVRLKAGLPADWTLLDAQRDLLARTGVRDDLTWAEFEADHGDPDEAVRHARAEYARNPGLIAADALGWALFKADRPREALRYAKQATSTGWRHPVLRYHRAEIERSLGRDVPLDPPLRPGAGHPGEVLMTDPELTPSPKPPPTPRNRPPLPTRSVTPPAHRTGPTPQNGPTSRKTPVTPPRAGSGGGWGGLAARAGAGVPERAGAGRRRASAGELHGQPLQRADRLRRAGGEPGRGGPGGAAHAAGQDGGGRHLRLPPLRRARRRPAADGGRRGRPLAGGTGRARVHAGPGRAQDQPPDLRPGGGDRGVRRGDVHRRLRAGPDRLA
ncbi:tetratricopeptide repeat protein [Nonomuraea ferruginea]